MRDCRPIYSGCPASHRRSHPCSCTAAGCTCSATCCSCGSTATMSKTPSGTGVSWGSTSSAASPRCSRRLCPTPLHRIPSSAPAAPSPGCWAAYLLLFPRARVLTLVLLPFYATTLELPARLLLLLWFAVQLVSDLAVPGGAGIAFRAHIGGFLTGMVLALLLERREAPAPQ